MIFCQFVTHQIFILFQICGNCVDSVTMNSVLRIILLLAIISLPHPSQGKAINYTTERTNPMEQHKQYQTVLQVIITAGTVAS